MPYHAPNIRRIFDLGWLPLVWKLKDAFQVPEFDETAFRGAFASKATRILWEAVTPCPCGDAQSPNLDCPVCGGDGLVVHHTQIVRGVAIGVTKQYDPLQKLQPIEPGTALVSLRGEHVPAVRDRLTFLDAYTRISGLFHRRSSVASPLERLRYPVAPWTIGTMAEGDITKQGTTVNVDVGVVDLRVAKSGVCQPALVEGQSFDLTGDGRIDWTLGDANGKAPVAPAAGEAHGEPFAVYYHTHPVYEVLEHSHALRATRARLKTGEHPQHLPVQVKARLEWLMKPSDI